MVGRIPLEDVILVRIQVWQHCAETLLLFFTLAHLTVGRIPLEDVILVRIQVWQR